MNSYESNFDNELAKVVFNVEHNQPTHELRRFVNFNMKHSEFDFMRIELIQLWSHIRSVIEHELLRLGKFVARALPDELNHVTLFSICRI
jgi:hypothetical protein